MANVNLEITLLDSSSAIIGDGPLLAISRAAFTESLDRAGEFSIELPATDERVINYLASAVYVRFKAADGYTRTGLIDGLTTKIGRVPLIIVTGYDLLRELGIYTCGWYADYKTNHGGGVYGDDVNSDIIPDLLGNTGWSQGAIDAGLGYYVGSFNSLSRLAAFDKLAKALNLHYRQGATERDFDFGQFGDSSGFRLMNVPHVLRAQDDNAALGLIDALEIIEDKEDVVNLIIPYGAGEDGSYLVLSATEYGKVKLKDLCEAGTTLPDYIADDVYVVPGIKGVETTVTANGSTTTVTVASTTGMAAGDKVFCGDKTNAQDDANTLNWTISSITDATHVVMSSAQTVTNGMNFITFPNFGVVDAVAYAANPREATIVFAEVEIPYRTTAGNIAQFIPTAYVLYKRAKTYLDQHATAARSYRVTPTRLPSTLQPGDTIRVIYHGRVTRNGVTAEWLDLDEDLYVINITRTYNADGTVAATLDVSDYNRQRYSDTRLVASLAATQGTVNTRV